jgi:hypothetical protein
MAPDLKVVENTSPENGKIAVQTVGTKKNAKRKPVDFRNTIGEKRGNGGESGILLPPLPASRCEPYTSAIIACVCEAYKRF